MIFSSGIFLFLFLPAVLLGYQLLSVLGHRALLFWLAFSSLVFYGYWSPIYLLLLGSSILLNFAFSFPVGNTSLNERARSSWLIAAITVNIGLLGWFKYLFPLLSFFHAHGLIRHDFGEVILPLGISFFTFTQIAYLIDVRQDVAKREGLLSYTVFTTFFPHLIAGPIIHPREIMPQLAEGRLRSLRSDDLALGMSWFVMGLAKKVLIADHAAPLANYLFDQPVGFGFIGTWLGVLCYAIQLYFDFSGYCDMAMGLARMFSIEFPINFNSPYKSANIIDFWQNWHMTLTRYLTEYLYTPILKSINSHRMDQGKKVSRKAQATPEGYLQMVFFPIMTTMFIAGIWHGAGLQFLIFGILHGLYLSINHAWRLWTPRGHWLHGKLPRPAGVLLTFLCVLIAEVFFRSSSSRDAFYVTGTLFGKHGLGMPYHSVLSSVSPLARFVRISPFFDSSPKALVAIALCFFIIWAMPNTQEILGQVLKDKDPMPSLFPRLAWRPSAVWCLVLTVVYTMSILMKDANVAFLYFQF